MFTDFFLKKQFKKILVSVLVAWFACVACFTGKICNTVAVNVDKQFYFLVSPSMHIQASTHFVEWSGGAGYLLKAKKQEYVAYAVYLSKDEGVAAQTSTANEETQLLSFSVEKLYFNKQTTDRYIKRIKGAFESFYGCLLVLDGGIDNLSHNGTQEDIKNILLVLQKQFDFLSQEYKNIFSEYAIICKKATEAVGGLLCGTIFLKDLRYLLCELCVNYIDLSKVFAI